MKPLPARKSSLIPVNAYRRPNCLPLRAKMPSQSGAFAHYAARLVEAPRRLKRRAVNVSEHHSAIHVGDAIVVAAEDAIGVRHADAWTVRRYRAARG